MASLETEIRKLRPIELYSLAKMLSPDFWKVLMGNIKRPGSQDVSMFTSEHVAMIETAAAKQCKLASEVFLHEWGTMGRRRPTIQLAIDLLAEVQLFRAADFLAVEVMKTVPLDRPPTGPAAAITIPHNMVDEYIQQDNPTNKNCNTCCHSLATDMDTDQTKYHTTAPHPFHNELDVIEVQSSESSYVPSDNRFSTASNLIKFSSNNNIFMKESIRDNKNFTECELKNSSLVKQFLFPSPNLSALKSDSEKHLTCRPLSIADELRSSELPLCINDRGIISSHEASYEVNYTFTNYNSCDFFSNTSRNFKNNDSHESPINTNVSHKLQNNIQVSNSTPSNIIDYNELPLTVLEFCKN